MVMNTSDLGSCRCLAGSPEQSFSPWVECCVVFGSARTLVTGMVPPSVKEQVDIATAWARLHSTYIKQTVGVAPFKVPLPLEANQCLHVHVSPGSANTWKNQTLGGAICIAITSLMTGKLPKRGVALAGEVCGSPGGLGNVLISGGESFWDNVRRIQNVDCVVLGSRTGTNVTDQECQLGISVFSVDNIRSALAHVFG